MSDAIPVPPPPWRRAVSVVSAIIRRDGEVVLVRNRREGSAADRWSLPGGSVHAGELLTEAVVREVSEETGLVVRELGRLAVYSEHYIPDYVEPMLASVFEVASWTGDVQFEDDPDGDVCECSFVPCAEAVRLIEQSTTFGPMSAPVVDYLRGGRQASWFWRIHDDGSGGDVPVAVL